MINKSIYSLKINPFTIFTLDKLGYTKIGHLITASYPELLYTNCFDDKQIKNIQNSLIEKNLNFISEINLNENINLKIKLIKFHFNEYQKLLKENHHQDNQIEHLRYSDSLEIIKPLYFLHQVLFQKDYHPDEKILLNNFIKTHPYMTISDFLYLNNNVVDNQTIDLIEDILGLPISCKLPLQKAIDRENQIFGKQDVESTVIHSYETNFSQDDDIKNFITKNKTLQKEKKHGNRKIY